MVIAQTNVYIFLFWKYVRKISESYPMHTLFPNFNNHFLIVLVIDKYSTNRYISHRGIKSSVKTLHCMHVFEHETLTLWTLWMKS